MISYLVLSAVTLLIAMGQDQPICAGALSHQEAVDEQPVILAQDVKLSCDRLAQVADINNFHAVPGGTVFRGAAPDKRGMEKLAHVYGIRTIIDLESFRRGKIKEERALASKYEIQFFEKPMKSYPWFLSVFSKVKKQQMDQILSIMMDPRNQPVYVHCMKGDDRAGLVIGLYLVKSGQMSPADACKDMIDHGFKPRFKSLLNYFEQETGYKCPPPEN